MLLRERNQVDKFAHIAGVMKGQTIMDKLIDDFYLLYQVKNIFSIVPNYQKYTELGVPYRILSAFHHPARVDWNKLSNFEL